jgi:parallel beta-helix repeat protein
MRTFFKIMLPIAAMLTLSALALGSGVASGAITTAYVSPRGSSAQRDNSCRSAGFSSINKAISAVSTGGTVVVCRGTYPTQAVIRKPLSLVGRAGAVIDARGQKPVPGLRVPAGSGVVVLAAVHVVVRGLEVVHAPYDGILVAKSTRVRVTGNVLLRNGHVGVDFNGTSFSLADHNTAKDNAGGGFLLADGLGRSSFDALASNVASRNPGGSGIIVAGDGAAGVLDNLMEKNLLTYNGTSRKSPGAGIAITGKVRRATVSGNGVYANTIYGNGLPGVTFRSPARGQNMSGNQIISNNIGTNDTVGSRTTGILIGASSRIKVLVSNNSIRRNFYGICIQGRVHANLRASRYSHVRVRVKLA